MNVAQYIMHLRRTTRSAFLSVCVAGAVLCAFPQVVFANIDFQDPSPFPDLYYSSSTPVDVHDTGTACAGTATYFYDFIYDLTDSLSLSGAVVADPLVSGTTTKYIEPFDVSMTVGHQFQVTRLYTLIDYGIDDFNTIGALSCDDVSYASSFTVFADPVPYVPLETATSTASTTVYVTNMGDVSFGLAFLIFLQSFQLAAFIYAIFISRKTKF